jgi:hypothetical protein
MKKMLFVLSIAVLIATGAVFFDWEIDTALHVSTGFLAGILVMRGIDLWRESKEDDEPR